MPRLPFLRSTKTIDEAVSAVDFYAIFTSEKFLEAIEKCVQYTSDTGCEAAFRLTKSWGSRVLSMNGIFTGDKRSVRLHRREILPHTYALITMHTHPSDQTIPSPVNSNGVGDHHMQVFPSGNYEFEGSSVPFRSFGLVVSASGYGSFYREDYGFGMLLDDIMEAYDLGFTGPAQAFDSEKIYSVAGENLMPLSFNDGYFSRIVNYEGKTRPLIPADFKEFAFHGKVSIKK